MTNTQYFFWFGTLALVWLTIQDYTGKKMIVDDRRNWVMLGVSISLVSHIPIKFIYYIFLTLFYILISAIMNKTKAFGRADNNSLSWIMIGLGIINPGVLVWFLGIFTVNTILYIGIKKILEKMMKVTETKPVQFYPVLLLSFVLNTLLFSLY